MKLTARIEKQQVRIWRDKQCCAQLQITQVSVPWTVGPTPGTQGPTSAHVAGVHIQGVHSRVVRNDPQMSISTGRPAGTRLL